MQASRNATQWIDVPFAVAPEAGWSCPMTAFYIAEDVTQLWFRLSTGADGVRIDDPALVEERKPRENCSNWAGSWLHRRGSNA